MPTERIAMRRVREMIRLKLEGGLSISQIAIRCGIARSTLREMVNRHAASGLKSRKLRELLRCGMER